jgi:glycosyltransferase involved in cell wall biosynthesis
MIRVLHILNELRPSGAEVMLRTAQRHWLSANIHGEILTTGPTPGNFAAALTEAGFPLYHLPFRRTPHFLAACFQFLRQNNFDLVHIHTERAHVAYAAFARLLALPVVRTVHAVFPFTGVLRLRRRLGRGFLRRLGVAQVSISPTVQAHELSHFTNPTALIENWIDTAQFLPPTDVQRAAARRTLDLPDNAFVLAAVGNCDPIKNHHSLLRALALVNNPRLLLLHAGCEDAARSEQLLARQLGLADRIRFLGPRNDIPAILHAADFFTLPSLCEGFGNAAAEAMAAGLPVILTDALPHFRNFGAGILWTHPDPSSLARAIVQATQMSPARRRELGGQLAFAAARQFSPKSGAAAYARLYEDLLSAPGTAIPQTQGGLS